MFQIIRIGVAKKRHLNLCPECGRLIEIGHPIGLVPIMERKLVWYHLACVFEGLSLREIRDIHPGAYELLKEARQQDSALWQGCVDHD